MATNPRIPDNRNRGPVLAPKITVEKRRPSWVPWLALLAGVAILAIIIAYMPRAPKQTPPPANATVPTQATGAQIQLSDLKLSPMGPDGTLNLDGMIFNNGNNPVIAITAEAIFRDNNGQVIKRIGSPMLEVEQNAGATKPFADDPIKPQARRPFRMEFANIPQNWNHQVPELRITDVSSTTRK